MIFPSQYLGPYFHGSDKDSFFFKFVFCQFNLQISGTEYKRVEGKFFLPYLLTYVLVGVKYTNSQSYLVLVLPQQRDQPSPLV